MTGQCRIQLSKLCMERSLRLPPDTALCAGCRQESLALKSTCIVRPLLIYPDIASVVADAYRMLGVDWVTCDAQKAYESFWHFRDICCFLLNILWIRAKQRVLMLDELLP